MYLFYVRHGDPIYDPDSLTEKGKLQAGALVKRFRGCGLDKIYSSTSTRAIMTATPTAEALGKEIELLDFANESHAWKYFAVDLGGWGWCFRKKEITDIFKSKEIRELGDRWYTSPLLSDYRFGEGARVVGEQVVGFMKELGYEYDRDSRTYKAAEHRYDRVALFAHGGFSMIFFSCLLGIPYPEFCTRFEHPGCSQVSIFAIDDEGEGIMPRMIQFSNDSHLYKEDLPTDHNGKNIY